MAVKEDYLFSVKGVYINGTMGPVYRRLKFLSFLTEIELALDPKDDHEELRATRSLRLSLRKPAEEHTTLSGSTKSIEIPKDESDSVDLMELFTSPNLSWTWNLHTGDLELMATRQSQTTQPRTRWAGVFNGD